MRLFAVILALACAVPACAGELSITKVYYRDTNASLHVILSNGSDVPVSVEPPVVNGFDAAGLTKGLQKSDPVLWYRCTPNPIPAHGMADLTIVLAEPTDRPVTVGLRTSEGQRITREIKGRPEELRFQAIRFDRDLQTIHVYTRWSDATASDALSKLHMDGRSLARYAAPWPARNFGGLTYTRVKLPKPLDKCSFHVFEAETEKGLSTGYGIRAIPAEFLIGVYGTPSPENIADWKKHGMNHYLSFGAVSGDLLGTFSEHGISVGAKYIPEPLVDRATGKVVIYDEEAARTALNGVAGKPGLLYHHLVDEPDVADYYVNRTLGASGMELVARGEFFERNDPGRYSFIQLDNTFRPNNYRVYGECADVLATHRYSLGNFLKSEAGESTVKRLPFLDDMLETLDRFRAATEPKPFFMVTQFFNLGAGRAGRPPTIDEMRLQCYLMVAGGTRGLIHYIHSGSTGGGEGSRTPELWDGMTSLHEELKRIGKVAGSGTPVPAGWAKSSSPNVLLSALLSGDEMAVILINLGHRSSLDRFTAVPVRDIKVSLLIPPWMDASALEVVPAEGGDPLAVTRDRDGLHFTMDEVAIARCLLVSPRR